MSIAEKYKKFIDKKAQAKNNIEILKDIKLAQEKELFRSRQVKTATYKQKRIRRELSTQIKEIEKEIKAEKGLLVRLEILDSLK